MECFVCKFAAGKLENGVPCDLIAASGLICTVGSEVCAPILKFVCSEVLSYVEGHFGFSPQDICDDLGYCSSSGGGRRRSVPDDCALYGVCNSTEPVNPEEVFSGFYARRNAYMDKLVSPVMSLNGKLGMCWKDHQTGLYSCLEGTEDSATISYSSSSGHDSGAIVGAVLGTAIACALLFAVGLFLVRRKQAALAPMKTQKISTSDGAADYMLYES